MDRCFSGRLPLAYAEGVLAGGRDDGWRPADLARLRVLLCDSAFEAGFELRDLIEAGETAPALGGVLDIEDTEALAHLRLLWSQRASRPWDRHAPADTVFDLAADATEYEPARPPSRPAPAAPPADPFARTRRPSILLCSSGVVLHGIVFTRPPRTAEVMGRPGRYELTVDGHRLWFSTDPEVIASRLERWCRYHFEEFLPATGDVHRWRSPHAAAVLRAWGTVRCPDCGRALLPRVGEVGVGLEEG